MIVILNGPCGVGKSTVAQLMASKWERSVHLRVDDVRNFIFDAKINEEQNMLVDKNVISLVRNYKEYNYHNIIIDNVYENKKHLNAFIKEIKKIDSCVLVIRLYVSIEENLKRNAKRKEENIMHESRVYELHEIFRNQGDQVGKVIDSTNISAYETTELIMEYIRTKI